ncbi:hypothetical protein [Comamonas piscis]
MKKILFLLLFLPTIAFSKENYKSCHLEKNEEIINFFQKNLSMIQGSLGEKYGGSWVEYDKSKKAIFVLALVKPAILDDGYFCKSKMKIAQVKFSYKYLNDLQEKIFSAIKKGDLKEIYGMNIEIQTNSFLIYTKSENFAAIKEWLKTSKIDNDAVKLINQNTQTSFN